MFRRIMMMLSALCLAVMVLHAAAQGTEWSVWAYVPSDGSISVITSSGVVQGTIPLPLPSGFDTYSRSAAVSADGRYIAYVVSNVDGELPASDLIVFDYAVGNIATTYGLPSDLLVTSLEFNSSATIFDEEAEQLAIGYLYGDFRWEIAVVPYYGGGNVPIMLNQAQWSTGTTDGLLPVVQNYEDGQASFTMIYYASEILPSYESFVWDSTTGNVTPTPNYPALYQQTLLSTDEGLTVGIDERFPHNPEPFEGVFPQINIVSVYDPARDIRYPIFNDPRFSINTTLFVENGERALVISSDWDSDSTYWRVINRNGVVGIDQPAPAENIWEAAGTPDGVVFVSFDTATLESVLQTVDTRSGSMSAPRELWTNEEEIRLIWVAGGTDGEYAPFVELGVP